MQSKTDSFMEALVNVVVGFFINFIANVILLPAFLGVEVDLAAFGIIGVAYTIVSVGRSYVLRRMFDGKSVWEGLKARFAN